MSTNPIDDVLKDCILELIDILKESCTQYSEAAGNDSHEHDLFDTVDMDRFKELENFLREAT